MIEDRNFDNLAERFQRNVYGGLKGDIRLAVLWRDLEHQLPAIYGDKPLRVLDVGAGLGQLAIRLAKLGHQVVVNDLSKKMLTIAKHSAEKVGVYDQIVWYQCPLQTLSAQLEGQFDLILCHAVVEWLAAPELLLRELKGLLLSSGWLSFSYYNRHALEYRNLIRGNFKLLQQETFTADPGSLTPGNPLYPDQVAEWANEVDLHISSVSGIRVFHDYVTTLRGGHSIPADVIDMELMYSQREPYLWLGRYIHLLLQ